MCLQKENEVLSKTIDWLRFPLAFLIVLRHADLRHESIGGVSILERLNIPVYDFLFPLIHTMTGIAVPLFFFFSGYLFFSEDEIEVGLLDAIKKNE